MLIPRAFRLRLQRPHVVAGGLSSLTHPARPLDPSTFIGGFTFGASGFHRCAMFRTSYRTISSMQLRPLMWKHPTLEPTYAVHGAWILEHGRKLVLVAVPQVRDANVATSKHVGSKIDVSHGQNFLLYSAW